MKILIVAFRCSQGDVILVNREVGHLMRNKSIDHQDGGVCSGRASLGVTSKYSCIEHARLPAKADLHARSRGLVSWHQACLPISQEQLYQFMGILKITKGLGWRQ